MTVEIFSKATDATLAAKNIEAICYNLSRSPLGGAYLSVINAIQWVITDEVVALSHKGRLARINPGWFCKLPTGERTYWLLHTVTHVVAAHTVVYREFLEKLRQRVSDGVEGAQLDHVLFAYALDHNADAILAEDIPQINGYLNTLSRAANKRDSITIPKSVRVIPEKASTDPFTFFQWLKSQATVNAPEGVDDHEPADLPGGAPDDVNSTDGSVPPPQSEVRPEDVQTMLDSFATERSMGKSAQGVAPVERALFNANPNPLPWNQILKPLLHSAVRRDQKTKTWKRLSPRGAANGLIQPGSRPNPALGPVVVEFDVSGSIGSVELAEFAGHLSDMLIETRPSAVIVLWVDDEVRGVQHFKPEDYGNIRTLLKPVGNGGTDMCAGLEWIRLNCKQKPVAMIVLTDGWTPFPAALEGYPIWWVVSTEARVPPTAGTCIRFRPQG